MYVLLYKRIVLNMTQPPHIGLSLITMLMKIVTEQIKDLLIMVSNILHELSLVAQ